QRWPAYRRPGGCTPTSTCSPPPNSPPWTTPSRVARPGISWPASPPRPSRPTAALAGLYASTTPTWTPAATVPTPSSATSPTPSPPPVSQHAEGARYPPLSTFAVARCLPGGAAQIGLFCRIPAGASLDRRPSNGFLGARRGASGWWPLLLGAAGWGPGVVVVSLWYWMVFWTRRAAGAPMRW